VLYPTRQKGETVVTGIEIEIAVVEIHGSSAAPGFTFPEGPRREFHQRLEREAKAAEAGAA
jgi:sRNA-binding carbon storage regulator CsrA